MGHALRLGRPFGIETRVHWTFGLLLAWAGTVEYQRVGWDAAIFAIALLTSLFACVLLHELGHCLAARHFGISTRSITLYPIGGVARLDAFPRQPWHEIVIAAAGPAVNVVLAALLFPVILFGELPASDESGLAPSPITLAAALFVANLAMVIFNLLPAFPMDGGRIFRAFLSLRGNYLRATTIAARTGQILAILFVVCGSGALGSLVPGLIFTPTLMIIGVFIFFSAGAERRLVQRMHAEPHVLESPR